MNLIGREPDIKCHLCSSQNITLIFKLEHEGKNYTVIACEQCETLQTVEYYDEVSPDYIDLTYDSIDTNRIWCQGAHKEPAFRQWWDQAQVLIERDANNLKLLDIGCGSGGFLQFARQKGFEVYGFDASRAQVSYAQQTLPHIYMATSVSDYLVFLDRPNVQFDLITLWDVLEHIRNPFEFLVSIRDILTPGGLLYLSVPNGRAMLWKRWIYRMLGRPHEHDWLPWEHVFYYSLKSFNYYLPRLNFSVVKMGSVKIYPRPLSLFELIRRLGFLCLAKLPSMAPQIFVWVRKPF